MLIMEWKVILLVKMTSNDDLLSNIANNANSTAIQPVLTVVRGHGTGIAHESTSSLNLWTEYYSGATDTYIVQIRHQVYRTDMLI